MTITQLIAALVAIQVVLQAPATQKATYSKAVSAAKAMRVAKTAFIEAVQQALIYLYGTDTAGLTACGITLPKPRAKMSVDQLAIAKARGAQTRLEKAAAVPKTPTATLQVTEADGTVLGQSANPAPAPSPAPAAGNEVTPAAVPAAK